MPTNKNAQIRYKYLDGYFRDSKGFSIDDIVDKLNEDMSEELPNSDGISKRTVQSDINFIRNEFGLEFVGEYYDKKGITRIRNYGDDGKVLYRYADKSMSIFKIPISKDEIKKLSENLKMLSLFEGLPKFDAVKTLMDNILEDSYDEINPIIAFAHNPYLLNFESHFEQLFNAIKDKKVITVTYKPFFGDEQNYTVHPYQLKQYNNRWFLVGLTINGAHTGKIWTYPFDRIIRIDESQDVAFEECSINLNDYFDDVIGVTVLEQELVEIKLKITKSRYNYIKTKPLHSLQKYLKEESNSGKFCYITLRLIPNPEFYSQILSFGEDVEVVSPEEIRETIKNKVASMMQSYNN